MVRALHIEELGQPTSPEAVDFADTLFACAASQHYCASLERRYKKMDETDSEKPALYALRAQASAQEIDQRLRVRDILEEHQGMLAVAGAIEHLGGSVKPGPTVEIDDSSFLISGAVSPTGHNKARISIVTQSGRAVIQFGVFGKQDESLWRPLRPCVLFGLPSEDGTSFGWNSLHLPLQPV